MQRFSLNTLSNVAAAVIGLGVGMWFTPYLVGNLGIEQYGLIPLAVSASAFLTLLTTALTTTVGRYLSMEMATGELAAARSTFNTVLFGSLLASAVLLPAVLALSWMAPDIVAVPEGVEDEARWLFLTVMVSVLVSAISTAFGLSMFVRSRFDLRNAAGIGSLAVRVALVVALFSLAAPSIAIVGLGYVAAVAVLLVGSVLAWRRLTPDLAVDPRGFSRGRLREVSGMASWMVVDQAGVTLFKNADIFLINWFLGNAVGGEYGIVLQIVWLVPVIAATAATPLQPPIFETAAREDRAELETTVARGSRILAIGMGLVIGLLAGYGRQFVSLWIGPEYVDLHVAMTIGAGTLALAQLAQPLMTVMVARKRHRTLGIATVATGAGHILTCLAVLQIPDIGFLPVVISGGIWVLAKTHGVVPRRTAGDCPKGTAALFRHSAMCIGVALATACAGMAVSLAIPEPGWPALISEVIATTLVAGVVYVIVLSTPGELTFLLRKGAAGIAPLRRLLDMRFAITLRRNRRAQSTYTRFQRLPAQFDCLTGPVLDRLRPRGDPRPLKVVVMGCSAGAEPYSIASRIASARPDVPFTIQAFDIDRSVIEKARSAVYSKEEVLANPAVTDDFIADTFEVEGGLYRVREGLRDRVAFEVGDATDRGLPERLGKADIVYAQNFIVHFRRGEQAGVFRNIARLVASPGALFADGMDIDLRAGLAREAGLVPVDCSIRIIHEQNEHLDGWPHAYWGLPPFEERGPWRERFATVFVRQ